MVLVDVQAAHEVGRDQAAVAVWGASLNSALPTVDDVCQVFDDLVSAWPTFVVGIGSDLTSFDS